MIDIQSSRCTMHKIVCVHAHHSIGHHGTYCLCVSIATSNIVSWSQHGHTTHSFNEFFVSPNFLYNKVLYKENRIYGSMETAVALFAHVLIARAPRHWLLFPPRYWSHSRHHGRGNLVETTTSRNKTLNRSLERPHKNDGNSLCSRQIVVPRQQKENLFGDIRYGLYLPIWLVSAYWHIVI